jgi:hypothetical protein
MGKSTRILSLHGLCFLLFRNAKARDFGFIAFLSEIDYKEPFIIALLIFHVFFGFLAILSRHRELMQLSMLIIFCMLYPC